MPRTTHIISVPPTNLTLTTMNRKIAKFLNAQRIADLEAVVEMLKEDKYDEDLIDPGAEAIVNHAYADKFEAFRFGYNQAISQLSTRLRSEIESLKE